MRACGIFLEHADSEPLSLRVAIWFRRATWFVIAIGVLSVIHAGVLSFSLHHGPGSGLIEIQITTFKIVIHLSYLYLVFWLLIFHQEPNRLYLQQITFPMLLFLGYGLFAASAYAEYQNTLGQLGELDPGIPTQKNLLTSSLVVFLLLYLAWFFRDLCELRANRDPKKRKTIYLWFGIELVACVLIGGAILHALTVFILPKNLEYWVFNKDTVIALSLALWLLIQGWEKLGFEAHYKEQYSAYLPRNTIKSIEPALTQDIPLGTRNVVIDIGCGDGKRLKELVAWTRLIDRIEDGSLKLIGIDRDINWEGPFLTETENLNAEFRCSLREIPWRDVGLIFLSHILYEPKTAKKIAHYISQCVPGTFVVVRGTSPNSIFAMVSGAFSHRLWKPTISHLWIESQLKDLVAKSDLVRVDTGSEEGKPDAIIEQIYELNYASIKDLQELLGHLYGRETKEMVGRYLTELFELSRSSYITNHDFVYVYQRDAGDVISNAKS